MPNKIFYGNAVAVVRAGPITKASGAMLAQASELSDFILVGIGSANMRISAFNPYYAEESEDLVKLHLRNQGSFNFETFFIDDYAHVSPDGSMWAKKLNDIVTSLGGARYLISGNPAVQGPLHGKFEMIDSNKIIPQEQKSKIHASFVNYLMVTGGNYTQYLDPWILDYILMHGIEKRTTRLFKEDIMTYMNLRVGRHMDEAKKILSY